MDTISALLALCEENPPVTGGFPSPRSVTRCSGIFCDLYLNKQLSKQSRRRWFDAPSRSLWRHRNVEFKISLRSLAMIVFLLVDKVFKISNMVYSFIAFCFSRHKQLGLPIISMKIFTIFILPIDRMRNITVHFLKIQTIVAKEKNCLIR